MDQVTWWSWLALVAVALTTFFLSGLWWVSGWQGGNRSDAGPVGTTAAVTALVGAVMWWAGWLP